MKKLLLFLIAFLIPFIVSAEEATDVTLKDLVLKKTEGYTEVLSDAEIIDNMISLNLKMYEVGDSAKYQFIVENDSSQDFLADTKNLVSDNPTVTYELVGENKSNLVEKNSSKKFTLTVTYQNEVDRTSFHGGKYDASSNKLIAFRDPSIINPVTGSIFYSIILTIIILTIGFLILKNSKLKTLLFLTVILIPISINASFEYDILFEFNITIGYVTPNPCTFDEELVQGVEYVSGQYTYRYMQDYNTWDQDNRTYTWGNIDNDGWGVHITDPTSTDPVTTTLCTSINDKPIVSMGHMFYQSQTTSVDLSSFDTINVINMNSMFYNCGDITELDLISFDTSNVTDMAYMFNGCNSLTSLDLSYLGGNNLTQLYNFLPTETEDKINVNMSYFNFGLIAESSSLFRSNNSIQTLNLSHANMSNMVSMSYAFDNMKGLESLDLSYANMSRVTYMSNLCYQDNALKNIDLSYADMSSNTTMYSFCQECYSLNKIDMSHAKTNNVTALSYCFKSCYNLKELVLTDVSFESVTTVYYCFNYCNSLTSLDLSDLRTPNIQDMTYFVTYCSSLKELNLSNWGSDVLSSTYNLVSDCYNLNKIIMDNFNFGNGISSSYTFGSSLYSINEIYLRNATAENASYCNKLFTFSNLSHIQIIDLTGFIFGSSMNNMFQNAPESLTTNLILTDSDTSHVTDMSFAFNCAGFHSTLDLSSWDTSNVYNFEYAFYASHILSLDLSSWDVSNATKMNEMFYDCNYLSSLNLKGWTFSKISNMTYMFGRCYILEELDITDWNFGNSYLNNTQSMFNSCSALTTIDLSGWTLNSNVSVSNMFTDNYKIETVILDDMVLNNNHLYNIFNNNSHIKKISAKNWVIPISFENVFFRTMAGGSSIEEIDVSGWDLSNTSSISGLFAATYPNGIHLNSIIGLDTWDASNVTVMSYMFQNCEGLTTLDLSNFDTSNVTNMSYMFNNCTNLTTLDLSGFDTSNVSNSNMGGMFYGCSAITTAYAKTQADADRLNASGGKPSTFTFVVKT